MSKITVVGMAPYAVSLEDGRHLGPGEITTVDQDAYVESCISAGKLAEVVVKRPLPASKPVPTTKIEPIDFQENE